MNSPNPAYYQALAAARGVRPTPGRSWSILLTSANHGTVGPLGSTFPHAGEHHERVVVTELVEAGAPPAPGVDLAGLVRFDFSDLDGENEQFGAVAGGAYFLAHEVEARCAAHVAAQAGQVAVPEGWTVERVGEAIHIKRADGRWCGYMQEIDSPAHRLTHEFLSAMLAAAPAAPAQAKPLPAAEVPLWDENGEPWNLAAEQVEYERFQASTAGGRQEGGA